MKLFPCLQIVIVVAFMGSMPSAHALELRLPIRCDVGATCEIQNYVDLDPSPKARDYQCGSRTYDGHKGIDFGFIHPRTAQRS